MSSSEPTAQELELENLMRERIEKHNADTRRIHDERNAQAENKTQQLVDLMREYFSNEYSELMEQIRDETTGQQEEPDTKDVNREIDERETETTNERTSLLARVFEAIAGLFRLIFGGGCKRRDNDVEEQQQKEGEPAAEEERRNEGEGSREEATREAGSSRSLDDVSDEIFKIYIDNHMTTATYQNVVQRFLLCPEVQENLAEDEISDLEKKLMSIVLNFGCTKRNFAQETGGFSASGDNVSAVLGGVAAF